MTLQWDDSLSVGVEVIDTQHRELFRRFGALIDCCQEKRGEKEIIELLSFLDDYVVFHFAEEQKLMERYDYPGLEDHRREHESFVRRLKSLQQDLDSEGPTRTLVSRTIRILLNWIVKHIKSVDLEFGAFLKTRLDLRRA